MLPPNPNACSLQGHPNVEGMFGDGMMDVFRTLQSLGLFDVDWQPVSCGVLLGFAPGGVAKHAPRWRRPGYGWRGYYRRRRPRRSPTPAAFDLLRHHDGITILLGKVVQRLIKRHQGCVRLAGESQQVTVTDPFRSRLVRKWGRDLA